MDLRPIQPDDLELITEFFLRVPERDRTFFNEDVLDPAVVEGFLRPREGDLRLILHDDDDSVVGWLALFGGVGWSHHVARIGLVVDPEARGRGLGKQLAREGLLRGLQAGYSKLVVEIIAEERPAIAMFQAIGFQIEALLLDHVRERAGNVHDLVVLTHHAEQARSELDAVGIGSELD
jgi:ribosomal protein S18 acetylase RimI-like enzyme